MKKEKVAFLVSGGITIISLFMPIVSFLGISINFMRGDGILILILCALAMVLSYFNKNKLCLVFVALSIIVSIYDLSKLVSNEYSSAFLGSGFYFLIIGLIAMLITSILNLKNEKV